MSAQMIELEGVQMIELSDAFLEAAADALQYTSHDCFGISLGIKFP
jgi:hypothetical protein